MHLQVNGRTGAAIGGEALRPIRGRAWGRERETVIRLHTPPGGRGGGRRLMPHTRKKTNVKNSAAVKRDNLPSWRSRQDKRDCFQNCISCSQFFGIWASIRAPVSRDTKKRRQSEPKRNIIVQGRMRRHTYTFCTISVPASDWRNRRVKSCQRATVHQTALYAARRVRLPRLFKSIVCSDPAFASDTGSVCTVYNLTKL